MKRQGIGGSMVFIGSKNAVAAHPVHPPIARPRPRKSISPAAWRSKVHPWAFASTSSIPTRCCAAPRSGRAHGASSAPHRNKISEDELEEHYRKRSLLQRSVFPEDIAEAVYFFASDLSAKSTGNFLNVDAGNAASFTR